MVLRSAAQKSRSVATRMKDIPWAPNSSGSEVLHTTSVREEGSKSSCGIASCRRQSHSQGLWERLVWALRTPNASGSSVSSRLKEISRLLNESAWSRKAPGSRRTNLLWERSSLNSSGSPINESDGMVRSRLLSRYRCRVLFGRPCGTAIKFMPLQRTISPPSTLSEQKQFSGHSAWLDSDIHTSEMCRSSMKVRERQRATAGPSQRKLNIRRRKSTPAQVSKNKQEENNKSLQLTPCYHYACWLRSYFEDKWALVRLITIKQLLVLLRHTHTLALIIARCTGMNKK